MCYTLVTAGTKHIVWNNMSIHPYSKFISLVVGPRGPVPSLKNLFGAQNHTYTPASICNVIGMWHQSHTSIQPLVHDYWVTLLSICNIKKQNRVEYYIIQYWYHAMIHQCLPLHHSDVTRVAGCLAVFHILSIGNSFTCSNIIMGSACLYGCVTHTLAIVLEFSQGECTFVYALHSNLRSFI